MKSISHIVVYENEGKVKNSFYLPYGKLTAWRKHAKKYNLTYTVGTHTAKSPSEDSSDA